MGLPGVGKGTQARMLCKHLSVPHVSTGDILREAVHEGSALGRKVRAFLESGGLVPDELMGEVVQDRLSRADARGGFVLDGFPRTVVQVTTLDRVLGHLGVALDRAFFFEAPEHEVVRRLSGRRVCPQCGSLYHLESCPPRAAGICDGCGSALVQRHDDEEQVVRRRLAVYGEQTLPVVQAYRERGVLWEIDGTGDADVVFERLKKRGLGQA